MARQRHLRNAPIKEALIDFRAPAAGAIDSERVAMLRDAIGGQYPHVEPLKRYELKFSAQGGAIATDRVEAQLGWLFRDADKTQVAQFRADGFTFNRLHPYTSWEKLFPQALELWRLYIEVAQPSQVSRLAVRFINRMPRYDPIATYGFNAPPSPPPTKGPLRIRTFLSRVVVYDDQRASSAVINQALEEEGETPPVLLDVDAFWEGAISATDVRIQSVLEGLRGMKNDIFFASITEETASFYE